MGKSLSIVNKIWLTLGLLIIGYFITMLLGFTSGRKSESRLYDVSEYFFPATRESQAALTAFNEQIKLYNDAVMMGDATLIDSAQSKGEEAVNHLKTIIDLSKLDKLTLEDVRATHDRLKQFTEKAQAAYKALSSDSETAADKNTNKLAEETKALRDELITYTKKFISDLKNELSDISSDTKGQRYFNLVVFVIVVIVAVVLSTVIISQSISRPLKNTILMVKDIAEGEGDLTKRLEVKRDDEVGELSSWFNIFIEKLQKIIQNIAGKADTLNISSTELSDLSGLMTEGANQMSAKSNAVASSAEDMNSKMDLIAKTMENAASNAGMVATAVEEMTATINEIAQNSGKAASITNEAVAQASNASKKVEELGIAAQEIGKVTETITDISAQTNL